MTTITFKNRTREEIVAAFRESLRKKYEWERQAMEDFKKIREERMHYQN